VRRLFKHELVQQCDCPQANAHYFGYTLPEKFSDLTVFHMVPTTAVAATDCCDHCGHFTYKTLWDPSTVPAVSQKKPPGKGVRRMAKPIRGQCVETGEVRDYPSIEAARNSGFMGARRSLLNGRPTCGWIFTYA
jgi:hypothetical protein